MGVRMKRGESGRGRGNEEGESRGIKMGRSGRRGRGGRCSEMYRTGKVRKK